MLYFFNSFIISSDGFEELARATISPLEVFLEQSFFIFLFFSIK